MAKIKIISKPEKKTSAKGSTYYTIKAVDQDGVEKKGNIFTDKEPEIDQELEVDEQYSEQYKNYSWYEKKEKKGGFGGGFKPGLSVEQQIRAIALQEAVKVACSEHAPEASRKVTIKDMAANFETFIKQGKQ